jgi:hypothetical protein
MELTMAEPGEDVRTNYESAVFPDIPNQVPDAFAAVIHKC